MMHYANLTRGTLCPHFAGCECSRFTRIQSTSCEQKRWDDVIHGAGPDFLHHMGLGVALVVHDLSERPHETRAMWQGLAWLRYAAERILRQTPSPITGRGGYAMEQYFQHEFDHNGDLRRALRALEYHLRDDSIVINVTSCYRLKSLDVSLPLV